MYVCVCKSVTVAEIVEHVRAGAGGFDEVQFETGLGTCCGRCEDTARALVAETQAAGAPPVVIAPSVARNAPAATTVARGHGACACAAQAECACAAQAAAAPALGAAGGATRRVSVSRRLPLSARSM